MDLGATLEALAEVELDARGWQAVSGALDRLEEALASGDESTQLEVAGDLRAEYFATPSGEATGPPPKLALRLRRLLTWVREGEPPKPGGMQWDPLHFPRAIWWRLRHRLAVGAGGSSGGSGGSFGGSGGDWSDWDSPIGAESAPIPTRGGGAEEAPEPPAPAPPAAAPPPRGPPVDAEYPAPPPPTGPDDAGAQPLPSDPSVDAAPAAEVGAAELVDVGFQATMPQRVQVGDSVKVSAVIAREALVDPAPGQTHAADHSFVAADVPLLLRIVARVGFVVVGDERKEVAVPPPGEPGDAVFSVRALEAGPGEVWITVSQDGLPITVLKLRPELVAEGTTSEESTEAIVAAPVGTAPLDDRGNRFEITEQARDGGVVYAYEIELPAAGIMRRFESPLITGDRDEYVASLYAQLEEWARYHPDPADLEENLRAFGGDLFDALMPGELRELLWENRAALEGVMVVSTEPFIPWELVHLKPPDGVLPDETCFLAQAGMVRWLWGSFPPPKVTIRGARRRYVVPAGSGLDATRGELKMLTDKLDATAIEPRLGPVRAALAEPDGFDLLHFAGHAEAESSNIMMARLRLDATVANDRAAFLAPSVVRNHGRFGSRDHRPLVVLNACQSARAGVALTLLGGFAEAFLERQAGAFVGSLWAVGDKPALTFVSALYDRLIDDQSFAEATAGAREATRNAGDATWLAYVVYARPGAKVEWLS